MELSEANSPLLNEYKFDYVKQILPQTFLGGLQILSTPYYVNILQLLLWSFPFTTGAILTLVFEILENVAIGTIIFAVIQGLLVFASHLVLNLLLLYSERKKQNRQGVITNNYFQDEDDVLFTDCCSFSVLNFILPPKKWIPNVLIHPLLAGVVSAFCFWFLLPSNQEVIFGDKTGAILYSIVGWFVSCVGLYPLVGQPPKEPNTLQLNDPIEIASATRALYIVGFAITR